MESDRDREDGAVTVSEYLHHLREMITGEVDCIEGHLLNIDVASETPEDEEVGKAAEADIYAVHHHLFTLVAQALSMSKVLLEHTPRSVMVRLVMEKIQQVSGTEWAVVDEDDFGVLLQQVTPIQSVEDAVEKIQQMYEDMKNTGGSGGSGDAGE